MALVVEEAPLEKKLGDDVVVGREGCCPPSMPTGGGTSCRGIFQVLMVSVDTNRVDNTFNIYSPLLKRLNHC